MPVFRPLLELPPKKEVIVYDEVAPVSKEQWDYIEKFLDVPNWTCPSCGCKVFGRTKVCPYNFQKQYCRTPRPTSYMEPPL